MPDLVTSTRRRPPLWLLRLAGWLLLGGAILWIWSRPHPGGRPDPETSGLMILRDQVYHDFEGSRRMLDVILPAGERDQDGEALRPAILAIHGGSWIGGSKSDILPIGAQLAREGFVVFAADYRMSRPGRPGWPGALNDLRQAVDWIRQHAGRFRVDPDRLAAVGFSAGGHLALLLGLSACEDELPAERRSRLGAVVSFSGPTDLPALAAGRRLISDPVWTFVGGQDPDAVSRAQVASPISHVSSRSTPILLIHGTDDLWIPPEQSLALAERLRAAGVFHRLIQLPGVRHGFGLQVTVPTAIDLTPTLLDFLSTAWLPRVSGEGRRWLREEDEVPVDSAPPVTVVSSPRTSCEEFAVAPKPRFQQTLPGESTGRFNSAGRPRCSSLNSGPRGGKMKSSIPNP